jgi:hypothetical protein
LFCKSLSFSPSRLKKTKQNLHTNRSNNNNNNSRNPITFIVAVPCGVSSVLPMFQFNAVPSMVSFVSVGAWGLVFSSVGLLNKYLVYRLLQMFQVWFLIAMSTLVVVIYYSIMPDERIFTIMLVYPLLMFSILLDAYPASTFRLNVFLISFFFVLYSHQPLPCVRVRW